MVTTLSTYKASKVNIHFEYNTNNKVKRKGKVKDPLVSHVKKYNNYTHIASFEALWTCQINHTIRGA